MEPLKTIETTVIPNPQKFTLFILIFMVGGILITMFLAIKTQNLVLIYSGVTIFIGGPFIFQKYFRKGFSQKATVKFFNNCFSVELRDLKTDSPIKEDVNRFEEIKSFNAYDSSKNDFSKLNLLFKNQSKRSYVFSGQQNDGSETDINYLVRKYVRAYNLTSSPNSKITIMPNLFATKASLYVIIPLIMLALGTIIFQILKAPKTIPLSVLGFFGIYLRIMALRKKDTADSKN